MTRAASAGARLRAALRRGAIPVPGVYDGLTALLAEKAGFAAGYVTGAGLSISVLGKPDIGLLTLTDVSGVVGRLTQAVDLPLIVDADTGYGGEWNVARAVRELERAGAAGIQIEDQAFPKRCGHLSGKSVIPAAEMAAKIRAAARARRDPSFVIIARTDARAVEGVKSALHRVALYAKAGADAAFPEALESPAEFRLFGGKKRVGWLIANMTEFGRSPILTVAELARLGFRMVLYPMTAFRSGAFAIEKALSGLQTIGDNRPLIERMQTRRELYDLNRYPEFERREGRYLAESSNLVRATQKLRRRKHG